MDIKERIEDRQAEAARTGIVQWIAFMQQGEELYDIGISGDGQRWARWPVGVGMWETVTEFLQNPIRERKRYVHA